MNNLPENLSFRVNGGSTVFQTEGEEKHMIECDDIGKRNFTPFGISVANKGVDSPK
jgi:hypothetical protein